MKFISLNADGKIKASDGTEIEQLNDFTYLPTKIIFIKRDLRERWQYMGCIK